MGGRGASSGISKLYGRTIAQDKTIKEYARKTANLKNEQYRIIDSNGNVLLKKQGDKHSVVMTLGEKREYMFGNISLHNHPGGGTFSIADLNDFGNGAKEIVAVAQEGTYRLINRKHGTKEARDGWLPMRERLKEMKERRDATTFDLKIQAQKNLENSRTNKSINAISNKFEKIRKTKGNEEAAKYLKSVGNKYDILRNKRKNEVEQEMRRLTQEMRRLETQWYHDFYKKHAREYGFTYVFEKKKQRLKAVK